MQWLLFSVTVDIHELRFIWAWTLRGWIEQPNLMITFEIPQIVFIMAELHCFYLGEVYQEWLFSFIELW